MTDGAGGVLADFGHGRKNIYLPRSICGLICDGDVSYVDDLRVAMSLQLMLDAAAAPYVKAKTTDVNPAAGQPADAVAATARTLALSRRQMLADARACHFGYLIGMEHVFAAGSVLGVSF